MKKNRNILIVTLVGFLAICLCLPGVVFSGKSPTPGAGIPSGYKVKGVVHGVLVAVFTPDEFGLNGSVQAILRLPGHVYFKQLGEYPELEFDPPLPEDEEFEAWYDDAALALCGIVLPKEILEDFDLPEDCLGIAGYPQILYVKICEKDEPNCLPSAASELYTKDVFDLGFKQECAKYDEEDECIGHVRVLHADVKVSFVCPK